MSELDQIRQQVADQAAQLEAIERKRKDAIVRPALEAALRKAGILDVHAIRAIAAQIRDRVDVEDDIPRFRDDYRDLQQSVWGWLREPENKWMLERAKQMAAAPTAKADAPQSAEDQKRRLGELVAGMPTQRIESKEALEAAVAGAFGVKPDAPPSGEPTLWERIGQGLVENL